MDYYQIFIEHSKIYCDTWQLGDLRSHNLIVLSKDPERKLSSIGDMLRLTTLSHREQENKELFTFAFMCMKISGIIRC